MTWGQLPVGPPNDHSGLAQRRRWLATGRSDHEWRWRWLVDHARDDLCVVCWQMSAAAEHWVRSYVDESHLDRAVAASTHASLGFCARHTRHFMADPDASSLTTSVFAQIVNTAAQRLRDHAATSRGQCPICESEAMARAAAIAVLARGSVALREDPPSVRLCAEHTLAVIRHLSRRLGRNPAGGAVARLLADQLQHQLRDVLTSTELTLGASAVTRADDDARRRAAWTPMIHAISKCKHAAAEGGAVEQLQNLLDGQSCPVCASATAAAYDYLTWLVRARLAEDPLDPEEALLCAEHLHDLAGRVSSEEMERGAASWVVHENARFRLRDLARLLDVMSAQRPSRRMIRNQVGDPARPVACAVCQAQETAQRSTWSLLRAGYVDRWTRELIDACHGVCLIHGAGLPASDPWGARLRARLALTGWELDEAMRHSRWDQRYDDMGAEMAVWRQVPTLLDGLVYCGCAPPVAGSPSSNQNGPVMSRRQEVGA